MKDFGKVHLTLGTEFLDDEKTPALLAVGTKIAAKVFGNREDVLDYMDKFLEKRYEKLAKRAYLRHKKEIAQNAVDVVLESYDLRKEAYKNWISKANEFFEE